MRSAFKMLALSGLALSLVGLMGFSPVQLGKYSFAVAQASEWSQPVLIWVKEVQSQDTGATEMGGQVEIELENGETLPLAPKAVLKNENGETVSLTNFTAPSKVRFLLDKGIVREMILIEALPR